MLTLPDHLPHVRMGEFVIMPNHVHGRRVFVHDGSVEATQASPLPSEPAPRSDCSIESDASVTPTTPTTRTATAGVADEPLRRSIRLQDYDYGQAGAYFVTICTLGRACLFGDITDAAMQLNEWGRIADLCWRDIPDHFPHVWLDAFVIMPNHVHGILVFVHDGRVGATQASPVPCGPAPRSVGAIVGAFKSAVTKRINAARQTAAGSVWQRNYYEHIIRNEESLNHIQQYILDNPVRWAFDRENSAAREPESEDAWRA